MAGNFTYKIVKHIGIISTSQNGWNKELNLVSWNNRTPVYDIREWSNDHQQMSRGISFDTTAALKLLVIIKSLLDVEPLELPTVDESELDMLKDKSKLMNFLND